MPIFVGEFGVVCWAKGGDKWLADCVDIFEEYGWDWTYHAFREWDGWSVEHVGERGKLTKVMDTPRKQVMTNYFKRNKPWAISQADKKIAAPADTKAVSLPAGQSQPAQLRCADKWTVAVEVAGISGTVTVEPPQVLSVKQEKIATLPLFKEKMPGWERGAKLKGVTNGCTTPRSLLPSSVKVFGDVAGENVLFEKDRDYQVDPCWGVIGRTPTGRIQENMPVRVDYDYCMQRMDSIVLSDKKLLYCKGEPKIAQPVPPEINAGAVRVANIYLPYFQEQLEPGNLYPIDETGYPSLEEPVAERLLPKTLAKLRNGEPVKILAWGDSVTDGYYSPDWKVARWQTQFAESLRARFPKANIELITEAWSGKNSESYLSQPAGKPHSYQDLVLGVKPDLVVSEFVNDSWISQKNFSKVYPKILADFKAQGTEWILIAPHCIYDRGKEEPAKQKNLTEDTREYIKMLRVFSKENQIPLADVAARYGRLWRQGIPFLTLMTNHMNHPNRAGWKIYSDALMALFPNE